jgi:hypothetical protein
VLVVAPHHRGALASSSIVLTLNLRARIART